MKEVIKKISNSSFSFKWHDVLHTTDVRVGLPILSTSDCQKGGDWGLYYEFCLSGDQKISIEYDGINYSISQKILRLETPMLSEERKKYPFSIDIEDDKRPLRFSIFLDIDFNFSKVKVFRTRSLDFETDQTKQLIYESELENMSALNA